MSCCTQIMFCTYNTIKLIEKVEGVMIKKTLRPQITAYEGILLVCSKLVQKGKVVLRQDELVSTLYNFKNHPATQSLLSDIAFKKDLDTITSVDVEDSLSKLQTFGAIGRLNPAYEKVIIYISPDEANQFLQSYDIEYSNAAEIISEAFGV